MEFNIDKIRENENKLREKYGKSARDLDRESRHKHKRPEIADISEQMNSLLKLRKEYNEKKQEVHNLIASMESSSFIYYPDHYANNWIEDLDILDYNENIRIRVSNKLEDDKVQDFCDRTGLKLIDVEVRGSMSHPRCSYIFAFDREEEYNPCEGCCSMIECEDCCYYDY